MTTLEFNAQLAGVKGILTGNAMRLSRDKHNAQDLMQETVMRAFASRHRFTEGSNFKAWMYTIMQNCYINEYRKWQTRNKIVYLMEDNMRVALGQSVSNMCNTVVMMKELRVIMDDLCEINRVPFEMFFEGYGYLEIAEQLDIPVGTVKSRIFFARKKLKAVLQSHYGDHVQNMAA